MKLGIIGGSGLYDIDGLEDVSSERVKTPFGEPSDEFIKGTLSGVEVFFLPRHGRGHKIMPSEINYRANIMGFKMLGVDRVMSVSAVGSLREELRPRDIVLPDQYFDRTKDRDSHTFFGSGIVAHVGFGDPTCKQLREAIYAAANDAVSESREASDVRVNSGGTYVNMEGPTFSTKAESLVHRQLGFDVVGMTSLREAKLCREAEICYQALAMVTDYDCWHDSEEDVTVEMVMGHLAANAALAKATVKKLANSLTESRMCGCGDALKTAVLTDLKSAPQETLQKLDPIIARYIS